jgi:phospholipase C
VWAKTVLLVMFDENDGLFDHAPPPAPPSRDASGAPQGGSTVDTAGEYHLTRSPADPKAERDELMGRAYGLGPRVPLYVISPWSRGGWVNSQVFDHTSVIRFVETRFGVREPNISPWRRAVCGDLTSALNFKTPNDKPFATGLPATKATADRAAALPGRTLPPTPAQPSPPVQAVGTRPSRSLPYALDVGDAASANGIRLTFANTGKAGAVFHVYDRLHLDRAPRRYTVEPGKVLDGEWAGAAYDLWILGPNGFHRHYVGSAGDPLVSVSLTATPKTASMQASLYSKMAAKVIVASNVYAPASENTTFGSGPGLPQARGWSLKPSQGWYDVTFRLADGGKWMRRLAGRIELGTDSISDPAITGPAMMQQPDRA